MSATDEEYLAERYGRSPSARAQRLGRVGIGLLALVGLAVALWVAVAFADQPVRWDDVGYRVDGPASTQITFDVIMDPGTTATCRVQALSSSYAQVGVLDVAVGPADTRTSRYVETIPTAEEAVTAIVDTCTIG
ncbi:MAG: DUF4307 domain-containing protein [Actinomycetales bacterium]|nr:DUF4307 domain-containing protein [Actinomycetales bacterium]